MDHVFLVQVSPIWKYWLSKLQPCVNNCNVDKRICQRNSNYHVKALSAGSPHCPCDWGLSQDTSPHRGKRGGRQVGAELLRVWETLISEASWTRCCSSWVILVGERCPSCFSCHRESRVFPIDHLLDSIQVGPDHLLGVKGAPREDDLILATTLARHGPQQRRPDDQDFVVVHVLHTGGTQAREGSWLPADPLSFRWFFFITININTITN